MRRFAWTAILLVPSLVLPAGATPNPHAVPTASSSAVIHAAPPPVHLSALGLLAPGTPQFLLGEPLKAGAYLGGTAALGVGTYLLLRQIYWPEPNITSESDALIMLNAAGISWLAAGALSTLDAYLTLQPRQLTVAAPAADAQSKPSPLPVAVPTQPPVSLPVATPPMATPTPQPTPTPAPKPAPSLPPTPSEDDEASVYLAYDLAGKGRYLDAVTAIQTIRDPDWLPKANVLLAEWSPKAVDEGLSLARQRLADGNREGARAVLDRISTLPRTTAQVRAIEALRLRSR